MKKRNAGLLFICGALFGLSIALCLGAVEKAKDEFLARNLLAVRREIELTNFKTKTEKEIIL